MRHDYFNHLFAPAVTGSYPSVRGQLEQRDYKAAPTVTAAPTSKTGQMYSEGGQKTYKRT